MSMSPFEQIKGHVDLLKVVSIICQQEPVRKGRHWFIVCPFHEDKNPSLVLDCETGKWNCFGCGEKGDVIDFVARYHNISLQEALDWLREKYSILIKKPAAKAVAKRIREQEKEERKKKKKDAITDSLCALYRELHSILLKQGLEFDDSLTPLFHKLSIIGYWLDLLSTNDEANWKFVYKELQTLKKAAKALYLKHAAITLYYSLEKRMYNVGMELVKETSKQAGVDLLMPVLLAGSEETPPEWLVEAKKIAKRIAL